MKSVQVRGSSGSGVWFVLLCAVVRAACTDAASESDVITLAVLSSPNSLDPRIGSDETSQRVHQLIYDNLLALDDQLRVTGGLASSWEQADPLTYVVHLRKGVRFHDGHELTADDVVYTFGCFIDPAFVSPRKGAYRTLDRVEAVDPYTVRFSLKEPFGSFPIQLVMPVVPKGAGPELRDHPIGTGPYKFVELRGRRSRRADGVPRLLPRQAGERRRGAEGGARRDHARARAAQGHASTWSSTTCRPTSSTSSPRKRR